MKKIKSKILNKININMENKYAKIYLYFLKQNINNYDNSTKKLLNTCLDNKFNNLFNFIIDSCPSYNLSSILLNEKKPYYFYEKLINNKEMYLIFSKKLNYILLEHDILCKMLKNKNDTFLKIPEISSRMQETLRYQLIHTPVETKKECDYFDYLMDNAEGCTVNSAYYVITETSLDESLKKIKILLKSRHINEIKFNYWLRYALCNNNLELYNFYKKNLISSAFISKNVFIYELENEFNNIIKKESKSKYGCFRKLFFYDVIKKDFYKLKNEKIINNLKDFD
jgi:hypothetical protein